MAFTDKVKIVKSYIPEKVKLFIEKNLLEELKYFQKKYTLKVDIISDEKLMIPEYKIELLNKSKKTIKVIENVNKIIEIKKYNNQKNKLKKEDKKEDKKLKKETKKLKTKKKLRTLWVRRKKKLN